MKKFYGDKQVKSVYVAKDGAAQENQLVDALAAGPVAGKEGAPIVLAGSKLADGQKKFLEGQGEVATVYEVGGGINTSTVKDLMTALGVKDVVDKAEVSSVKATNLKEVVVTFGTKVDTDSAEDVDNYTIDDDDIKIDKATLSEDGRTVVLEVKDKLKNQQKYELEVEGVTAGDKEIEGKATFTPADNAFPEVKEVVNLGTKAVKVVFSEPVTNVNAKSFKLDGKTFYGSTTPSGRSIVLTPYEKVLTVGDHKLEVEGVEDYAGLKSLPCEKNFTVVEDKVAPTVEKATATLEKLTVTFSEDVDPDTVKESNVYYKNGDNKIKADGKKELAGNKYEFYFSKDSNKLPSYEVTINIEDVKDYSGNKITETQVKVKPEVDQTRPEVKKVTTNTNKDKITVKFSKNIHDDSVSSKHFTIKDKDDKVLGIKSVTRGDDKKTLVVELYNALPKGKNTIKISGVKDSTHLQNSMEKDYVKDIQVGDTKNPVKDSEIVYKAERTVVIGFNKKMDAKTLDNKGNYTINGVDKNGKGYQRGLPDNTEISVIQEGKAVKLVFPKKIDKEDYEFGKDVITLNYMGLKDEAGNPIDPYSGSIDLRNDTKSGFAKDYNDDYKGKPAITSDRTN